MKRLINRRAKFDYEFHEKYEAGIVLSGSEAKALRLGRGDISQAHIRIIDGEAYLINANIPTESTTIDPNRTRKLLLHKSELNKIEIKIKANKLTLVPLKVYNKGRVFKLELGLGKSKRKFQKKEALKKKDIKRELDRELKGIV